MIRTICAEVLGAIIFVVPGNKALKQVLRNVKAGSPREYIAKQTQFESRRTTYCLGSRRGLRSSLFLNIGE